MEEDSFNNDIGFIQSKNNKNLNSSNVIDRFEQHINAYNKFDFILENLINNIKS